MDERKARRPLQEQNVAVPWKWPFPLRAHSSVGRTSVARVHLGPTQEGAALNRATLPHPFGGGIESRAKKSITSILVTMPTT
jgi:hypothetical protein